ncbi:MAG: hypothetical protein WD512_13000, partial [Candidatus Paceibacterota bacterium]
MLKNQVIEDNQKVEKELHLFKEKASVLISEILNECEKNIREKIMADNYEYKSLYDYTGIEELSSEFDNPKYVNYTRIGSEEKIEYRYSQQKLQLSYNRGGRISMLTQKDLNDILGEIHNDEKWLLIHINKSADGQNEYGILSTYGKLIT